MPKTSGFHCRGCGFHLWLGNWDPACLVAGPKKKKNFYKIKQLLALSPKKLQTPALKSTQLCHKPEGRPGSRWSINMCAVIYSLQSTLRNVIESEPTSKEMEILIIPVLQRPALRPRVQALAPQLVQGGAKS